MEHDHRPDPVQWVGETLDAVDSATVLLLRDGASGPEVFMLERHLDSDFAGGALVFPGGKVDDRDRTLDLDLWVGCDPETAMTEFGAASEADALGIYVAAVRETFEEAGVLLASRGLEPITVEELRSPSFVEARRRLADRADDWDWVPWLRSEGLVLALGALAFWSWWATPDGVHRRFDTRFFVAKAPPAQAAGLQHDDVETTASRWTSPAEAIQAHEEQRATVIFPTRTNLEALAAFRTADDAWLAAVDGRTDRRRIQPTVVVVDGQPMVQHPDGGDPQPI